MAGVVDDLMDDRISGYYLCLTLIKKNCAIFC